MSEHHVTFAEASGWLSLPEGPCRTTAVVLCAPFGAEWLWVYRSYRALAHALTQQGFAVIRFDYRGTGDALGDENAPHGVREWLDTVHAAAELVKSASGATALAMFGLRLGGTIASAAAAERSDVRSLLLWAPYASGRAFMREARAFARLRETSDDSVLSVGGFIVPPALEEEVRTLALPTDIAGCRDVMLLARDDLQAESALAGQFRIAGAEVTESAADGYAAMMRDAYDSRPPMSAIAEMVSWLSVRHAEHVSVAPIVPGSSPLQTDDFVECSYQFGDGERLFGILTAPRAVQSHSGPFVILPNVGSNHHIGPARLMVTLARALARRGFSVLRFDVGGLGDSRAPAGQEDNTLYADASQRDAMAAMTFLDTTFGPHGYVFAGVCSGAYLSYHTAIADPRVVAQILINILTFHWNPGDTIEEYTARQYKSSSFYMSSWNRLGVWQRALRGDVNVSGIAGSVLRNTGARFAAFALRLISGSNSDVHQAFRKLADRGTHSYFIFGAEDAGLDEVQRVMRLPARLIAQLSGVELKVVPDADHVFTVPSARAELIEDVQEFLMERFPV